LLGLYLFPVVFLNPTRHFKYVTLRVAVSYKARYSD